jgi:alpha-L-fucosidase
MAGAYLALVAMIGGAESVSAADNPKFAARLKEIDAVADRGPFKPNWKSLETFRVPDWYQEGKFGIFIHWGVYSVPAFGNEWYPRNMYQQGSPEFKHHVETYGPQLQFGYKD